MPKVTQLGSARTRTPTQASGPKAPHFAYFMALPRVPHWLHFCVSSS